MTDLDQIVQAIIARPDDDGLRRIYADHLADIGETDRAEFVRVQLELAALPSGDWREEAIAWKWGRGDDVLVKRGQRVHELSHLEKHLLTVNPHWGRDLAAIWHGSQARRGVEYGYAGCCNKGLELSIHWEWHRGMVDEIRLPMEEWLRYGQDVVRTTPIDFVLLSDKSPEAHDRPGYPTNWSWYRVGLANDRATIDGSLFRRLGQWDGSDGRAIYYREDDANAALSKACIKYAKAIPAVPHE